MKVDIGRVFSNTWAMTKERFWLLLGLWVVYFAVQMVVSMLFGGLIGGSMFALGAASGGLDDPDAMLGGLGIGFFLLMIVFYAAYILIILAQQCAMAIMATPLYRSNFGDAFSGGFKSAISFLGVLVLLALGYIAFFIVFSLVTIVLSLLGDIGGVIALILIIPVMIYLMLRLSVIVPVVAVDRVTNPIKALVKTWKMTSGNVLAVFVVYVVFTIAAMVVIGLPFVLTFGSVLAGGGSLDGGAGLAAAGSMIFGVLMLFPLFIIFSIISVVIVTCLHAEMTESQTENLQETFS